MNGNILFGMLLHHLLSFARGFSANWYHHPNEDNAGCNATIKSSLLSLSSSTLTLLKVALTTHERIINNRNGNNFNSTSIPPRQRPLLLISYKRMKSNLQGEVLHIIDFLGPNNIPEEALDNEILPIFNFCYMRENAMWSSKGVSLGWMSFNSWVWALLAMEGRWWWKWPLVMTIMVMITVKKGHCWWCNFVIGSSENKWIDAWWVGDGNGKMIQCRRSMHGCLNSIYRAQVWVSKYTECNSCKSELLTNYHNLFLGGYFTTNEMQ